MTSNLRIRKPRANRWTSESSARANAARWAADRACRDAESPARMRELAEIAAENLPHLPGDPLGLFQFTDFRTGRVMRWTVLLGDRSDRVVLRSPDGRLTKSHGWSWIMTRFRKFFASRTSPI